MSGGAPGTAKVHHEVERPERSDPVVGTYGMGENGLLKLSRTLG